jgi:hypothetical protein
VSGTANGVEDSIEALCQHHDISSFKDQTEHGSWLGLLKERSAKAYGDRVLVASKDAAVHGFVYTLDIPIETPSYEGVYFFVGAVAVSEEYVGSSLFTRLIREAKNQYEVLKQSIAYRGLLAQPGRNVRLQRGLEQLGFGPMQGDSRYWVRLDPSQL